MLTIGISFKNTKILFFCDLTFQSTSWSCPKLACSLVLQMELNEFLRSGKHPGKHQEM